MGDLREQLSLPGWDSLDKREAEASAREVEKRVSGARFVRLEEHALGDQRRRAAVFEVDGIEMVLVPGAKRTLGFDPARLDQSAGVAWSRSFQGEGHEAQQVLGGPDVGKAPPEDMVQYLEEALSPRREVSIAPFLLERSSRAATSEDDEDEEVEEAEESEDGEDPHIAKAKRVVAGGFRLPTADEWEHACSGGSDALFRWGDAWPLDTDVWDGGPFKDHTRPNAFGLRYGSNPYRSEIVDDPEELHHGDGGTLVCGESGPIAWVTFSPWYRYRMRFTDDREIWFEEAYPRRARSIFPVPGEGAIREYEAPSILENAEFAYETMRLAALDASGLVLDDDEREGLLEQLPNLDAILGAHKDDPDVLAIGATLLRKLSRFDEALKIARRAVALKRDWLTVSVLGTVHRARDEVDEAVKSFDEAAELDDSDVSAFMDAGDTLGENDRFEEAAERYTRALERDPKHPPARVMLPFTRFLATEDHRYVEELRAYVRGEGKHDEFAHEVLRELPSAPPKKTKVIKTVKKKAPPKKAVTVGKSKAKPKTRAKVVKAAPKANKRAAKPKAGTRRK
jgi:tetratricopeptide (TPR) repeat protein